MCATYTSPISSPFCMHKITVAVQNTHNSFSQFFMYFLYIFFVHYNYCCCCCVASGFCMNKTIKPTAQNGSNYVHASKKPNQTGKRTRYEKFVYAQKAPKLFISHSQLNLRLLFSVCRGYWNLFRTLFACVRVFDSPPPRFMCMIYADLLLLYLKIVIRAHIRKI